MSDDWDSKTVIGFKKQVPKVAKKESDINGASLSLSLHIITNLVFSRKYSHATSSFTTSYLFTKARRSGAVVATDKKMTAGGNKAHQGNVESASNYALKYLIQSQGLTTSVSQN